jgi:NADH dehydrogenase FAD-containing subunit
MDMSDSIPVLIAGAGPTGLMMACELARHVIFIIRPDNYIAYCSKSFEINLIEKFFQKYLI